jgi:hypothetical protein
VQLFRTALRHAAVSRARDDGHVVVLSGVFVCRAKVQASDGTAGDSFGASLSITRRFNAGVASIDGGELEIAFAPTEKLQLDVD